MKIKKIKIIVKEPGKEAYVKEIENKEDFPNRYSPIGWTSSFDSILKEIGAETMDTVTIPAFQVSPDKRIVTFVDDEGIFKGLKENFYYTKFGVPYSPFGGIIYGTAVIVSYRASQMKSLTDQEIATIKKYLDNKKNDPRRVK